MRFHTSFVPVLGILLAAAPRLAAQDQYRGPFHVVAGAVGATTLKVETLNVFLTRAQFAGLSNDGVSYGGTGYFAVGRALLGGEVTHSVFGEEGLDNGRSDDLGTTQVMATIGYAVGSTRNLNVYPMLGAGVGRFELGLRDRAGGAGTPTPSPTFAELAADPGTARTVSGSHLLFSAGAGADLLVMRRGDGGSGVVLGIRAGVLVAPNRTTWSTQGGPVIAGPDASAEGPFLRVLVGFGRY